MDVVTFNGFPKESIRFLIDLKANNNREWFQQHKPVYLQYINQTSKAFVVEMEERLIEITGQPMSSKIYRIYRDVRFSKDKTPYNPYIHISFFLADLGKQSCGIKPSFHFGLETDELIVGTGSFEFTKENLITYRDKVANDTTGEKLATILKHYNEEDGYHLDEPVLKHVPAGFDKNHPRENLLRRKGLVIWHKQPHPTALNSVEISDEIMDRFRAMKPVYDWLDQI